MKTAYCISKKNANRRKSVSARDRKKTSEDIAKAMNFKERKLLKTNLKTHKR